MYKIQTSSDGILHLRHGDKQGTAVLKRLGSISGRATSTLMLGDANMPRIHKNYLEECAQRIVSLYKEFNPKQTFETIVFGSPHQTGLYIAELMNVPFLPLQFIGFADSLQQLEQLNCLKIIGCDYDYTHLCWLWCKIGSIDHLPVSYLKIFQCAKNVIIVRANSKFRLKGRSDFCMGKINQNTYVHSSIKMWKKIPQNFETFVQLAKEQCQSIRQWEFGLPDQTIYAVQQMWNSLHPKQKQNLYIIQNQTVDLYKFIPYLYFQHYKQTKTEIRGLSLNPYYTLHPCYEKSNGLLPFVYYNFNVLGQYFQTFIDRIKNQTEFKVDEATYICFANMVEGEKDLDVIKKFWKKNGFEKGWFSVGYDCVLAKKNKSMTCKNIFGEQVPLHHIKINEWMQNCKHSQIPLNNVPAITVKEIMKIWSQFLLDLTKIK